MQDRAGHRAGLFDKRVYLLSSHTSQRDLLLREKQETVIRRRDWHSYFLLHLDPPGGLRSLQVEVSNLTDAFGLHLCLQCKELSSLHYRLHSLDCTFMGKTGKNASMSSPPNSPLPFTSHTS